MIYFPAIVGTILGLKRRCGRCRRDQIVPRSKRHKMVKCKFCGAEIPPKRPR